MTDYITQDSILTYQAAEAAFAATPLGKAFNRFKNTHSKAWQMDTEDSLTDKDRMSTKQAWDACKIAENELKSLINDIYKK